MGIDRDEDGVLDGDVPPPLLQVARAGNNAVLNWPLSAAGYNLEMTPLVAPAAWNNSSDPIEILSGQNYVTNSSGASSLFFRLRFQP